jgi:hypothetical protein
MSAEKQEGQKTVVSFIVGLLIGGLLVWAFSGPAATAPANDDKKDAEKTESSEEMNNEEEMESSEEEVVEAPAPVLEVGEGKVTVEGQPAGTFVTLTSATYPVSEGWIGVRDYSNGQLGGLLGVVRFSEEQALVPNGVYLQRATVPGVEYAVVVYTENGDREFSLANDKQLDSVFATFTAQ